jgi:5-methylcytosine-specific restriction endonuclease McrA
MAVGSYRRKAMLEGQRTSEFFSTYYFADIIANVLQDPLVYMQDLEAFCHGDNAPTFLPPFPRWSALHRFAEFMIDSLFWETDVEKYKAPDERRVHWERFMASVDPDDGGELWVERAFRCHGISFVPFSDWSRDIGTFCPDALHDWYSELRLCADYAKLINHLASDVFAVLFSNRGVLQDLNRLIAHDLLQAGASDDDFLPFANERLAKRQRLPQWARRAVFYRDRGRCCFCHCDLSGLLSSQSEEHFDHIVPLALGGINDVTNLQLLCKRCNTGKGARHDGTSSVYGSWYDERERRPRVRGAAGLGLSPKVPC